MRSHFSAKIFSGCALAGAILYAPAAVADWHSPHFQSETHGTWTNVEYDDGICHYKYSHNAWDNETRYNRWGDCSRIVIGPGGQPQPVSALVVPLPQTRIYRGR